MLFLDMDSPDMTVDLSQKLDAQLLMSSRPQLEVSSAQGDCPPERLLSHDIPRPFGAADIDPMPLQP